MLKRRLTVKRASTGANDLSAAAREPCGRNRAVATLTVRISGLPDKTSVCVLLVIELEQQSPRPCS